MLLDGVRSLPTVGNRLHISHFSEIPHDGLARSKPPVAASRAVLRPVHYLGNKQRSLDAILPYVAATIDPGEKVADLFCGTSVVAQGMASLGASVLALDVSPACAVMARATLGVGRSSDEDPVEIFETVANLAKKHIESLWYAYGLWVEAEDQAVLAADGEQLLSLGLAMPQVWRSERDARLEYLFENWRTAASTGVSSPVLLSPVYAGTYLGIRQTMTLDAYRTAVEEALEDGLLTQWQGAAVITSLLSAASRAAFTAGKHFAQPYRLDSRLNSRFHRQRVVDDRAVDISLYAADYLKQIVTYTRHVKEAHEVLEAPIEGIDAESLASRGVRLVYADPPYTAQQYSRFYHVLDTFSRGRPQPLQEIEGKITKGLYPVGRHMSSFCRKTQAVPALRHLVQICRKADATLLLSYSFSAKTSNGNKRILEFREITEILSEYYSPTAINVTELDHQYRQFNHGSIARSTRADIEILISAHVAE